MNYYEEARLLREKLRAREVSSWRLYRLWLKKNKAKKK
jgi:hypothetical protein